MLLYPHHGELGPEPEAQHFSLGSLGADESLILASIDLGQRESMDEESGSKLSGDNQIGLHLKKSTNGQRVPIAKPGSLTSQVS